MFHVCTVCTVCTVGDVCHVCHVCNASCSPLERITRYTRYTRYIRHTRCTRYTRYTLAGHWSASNVDSGDSSVIDGEVAYVLSYSIIMLNTDLHNPQARGGKSL